MANEVALPTYETLLIDAIRNLAIDSGTVSVPPVAGVAVLQDDSKNWSPNAHAGRLVKIIYGIGAGQLRIILSNGDRLLTLDQAWTVSPNQTSVYVILGLDVAGILRNVFGSGADISAANPLQVYDPKVWGSVSGLILQGVVTAVPGANQFTIPTLANLGAGKFDGATNPYYAFVLRDGGGAGLAPQGEQLPITAYNSATGTFTTAAFTVPVAVGDEILIINPALAHAIALGIMLNVPAPDAVANVTAVDVIGNKADTAILVSDDVSSVIRYLKGILNTVVASNSGLQEQPDTAVNINAIAANETDVLNLAVAATRYIVRSLRLKCANPGANTVTVRLYELVNNLLSLADSFDITNANFSTYHSCMDMFGLPYLAGDHLQITVQVSAGAAIAVTGQYTLATATV